jgi:uncharacterized protein (DUF1697 family)
MATWIALFRGINVGGHQILSMKDLRALLELEGFTAIRTYIQSGNVVFKSAQGTAGSLTKRIGNAVQAIQGFRPRVIVLSAADLQEAAAANPFPKAQAEHKSLHLFFLAQSAASADVTSLSRIKTGKEAFVLKGKVLYLLTPDGFGTSKLAASIERYVKVEATARNWRTVTKLLEMIESS